MPPWRLPLVFVALLVAAVATSGSRSQASVASVNELPAWSPDGSKIAFHSSREGNGIWVMDADGRNQRPLTRPVTGDLFPSWSPDGSKIAFARLEGGGFQIHVMNADGTGTTKLTAVRSNFEPAWSPDGRTIAFASDRDGNREIYVMNPDGSDEQNLTRNPALDTDPDWSPDGAKIAFASNRDGDFDIYVMNVAGGRVTQPSNDAMPEVEPAWSPDGARLAFSADLPRLSTNLRQLHVVSADGSGRRRIQTAEFADQADWSPDGMRIAFSLGGLMSDIYVVAPDGSTLQNLTRTSPTPAPRACVVPKVKGETLASAKHAIVRANCSVGAIRRTYSAKVKKGRIVSQSPKAGARLRNRGKVNLVVSRGPKG